MGRNSSASLVLLACTVAGPFAGPSLFAQEAAPPQPTVTMEFKRADLVEVIELLTKDRDGKVVIDPGVKGEVTMRFSDVPWRKALDAVVKVAGYALVAEDDGKTLRVADPVKLQLQMQVLLDVTLMTTSNADLIEVFSKWSQPFDGCPVDRTASKFPFHIGTAQADSAPDAASGVCLDACEVQATLRLCRRDVDTEFIQRANVAISSVGHGTRIGSVSRTGDAEDNATMPRPGQVQVRWEKGTGVAANDDAEVYLIPHLLPNSTRILLTIVPSNQVPEGSSSPFEWSPSGSTASIDGCPRRCGAVLVTHRLVEADQTIVIDGGQATHPRLEDRCFLLVTPHVVRRR